MVSAEEVIGILQALAGHGIPAWLTGGWGIDALLGVQSRPHKDLDLLVELDDVHPLREILAQDGFRMKELWSENAWAVDSRGARTPTAFVLNDAEEREIDLHALRLDKQGHGTPAWSNDAGLSFTREDLAGEGLIAGFRVRCVSPAVQLRGHTGYELPSAQARDLELLRAKFGLE